jgi:hypothetical protein
MPTTITGTDGVSQVQTGSIQSDDLAAGVGGKVVQVVSEESTTINIETTSTSYQSADITASITPSSNNSKILIFITFQSIRKDNNFNNGAVGTALFKDNSIYKEIGTLDGFNGSSSGQTIGSVSASFLDSPSTTNEVTYEGKFKSMDGNTVQVNARYGGGDDAKSTVTLMEIAG